MFRKGDFSYIVLKFQCHCNTEQHDNNENVPVAEQYRVTIGSARPCTLLFLNCPGVCNSLSDFEIMLTKINDVLSKIVHCVCVVFNRTKATAPLVLKFGNND